MLVPRRVVSFFVLAFAVSWGLWAVVLIEGGDYLAPTALPFFVLASFGPLIAAAVMRLRHREDRRPVLRHRRSPVVWLPVSLALGAVGALAAAAVVTLLGRPDLDPAAGRAALLAYGSPVVFLVVTLVVGPLSEEPGWRGWLHPRLREHHSLLWTTVVFGPLWAVWHLPLFLIAGTYQNTLGIFTVGGLLFLISTTALSTAVAYAYEHLGGLPAAIAVHFASNALPAALGLTSVFATATDTGAKVVLAAVLLRAASATRVAGPQA